MRDQCLRRTNLAALDGSTPLTMATYSYDTASRLATVSDGNNNLAAYSYLANSPLVGQINFSNKVSGQWHLRMTTTKQYDFLNRLTFVGRTPASGVGSGAPPLPSFTYAYNNANQRVRVALADGSYWLYEYDALGQVISGKRYWPDGTPVAGQQFEYAFDHIGNRTQTKAGGDQNGWNLRTATYTANLLNQYTSRTVPGYIDIIGVALAYKDVTVNGQTAYRKGEYFRRELSVNNSSAPAWEQVTVSATDEPTVTGRRFVPRTPEQFTYDADGNMTSDGRWSFSWDAENRLVQVESRAGGPSASKRKVTWQYDAKGRRIRQTTYDGSSGNWIVTEDLKFISDPMSVGRHILELNAGDNTVVRGYVWGIDLSGTLDGAGGVDGLLWVTMNSGPAAGTHFAAYDGNGNVVGLISASTGTETARYEYGPFGEPIRVTGTASRSNPFRFSTKRADDTTDLVLYEYRAYNPSLGRWLSRDPIGEVGGVGLVCFLRNSPSVLVDAWGLYYLPYPFPRLLREECKACKCRSVAITANPNDMPRVFTAVEGLQPGNVHVGFPVHVSIEVDGDISKCKCKHSEVGTVQVGWPKVVEVNVTGERSIPCTYKMDAPGYMNAAPPPPGQGSELWRLAYNLTITIVCTDSDGQRSISGSVTVPNGPFWFTLQTDQNGTTTTIPVSPPQ